MDEQVKEAFSRVKEDIFSLGSEIAQLKLDINELRTEIKLISRFIEDTKLKELRESEQESITNNNLNEFSNAIKEVSSRINDVRHEMLKISEQFPTHYPTHYPTHPPINSNTSTFPTDNPTLPHEIMGLLDRNKIVSTGNEGVPTDRQTNQQTDQQIIQNNFIVDKTNLEQFHPKIENHLEKASEILASLDGLKKEVRLKFKRITHQEMQVFSLLYSLEDSGEIVDYKILADRLNLSESSIRDYIHKLQKKGIPIDKEKHNNKRVILHVSKDLKKIASLNTILKLREL